MRIPKRYGQSLVNRCPFCQRQATTENYQGVPTCLEHKKEELLDLKCACGEYLDIKKGKYGAFFLCMNCGPVSFAKGLEMNPPTLKKNVQTEKKEEHTKEQPNFQRKDSELVRASSPDKKREMTIRSDEMDF